MDGFENRTLHAASGTITEHCFKLTASRRLDVLGDGAVYDESMVVYDGGLQAHGAGDRIRPCRGAAS